MTEGVIFAVDEMDLTVKVDALIPKAVRIRGNDIARTVNHVGRPLVLGRRFVNRQGLCRLYVGRTDFVVADVNDFRRIEGSIG